MDDGRVAEAGSPAPTRSRWRPRAPLGFLGMVALVLAVEATLAGHDANFTEIWHWDWRIFGRSVATKAKGRDVLFFGDSAMKFGIMPRIIRDRSKLDAYNFAIHVGQTSTSYFMFRRALEGGARPKAVVLDATPHLLSQAPNESLYLWGE